MAHDIELNSDLETHAATQAAAIRGDVRSGTAQPPGDHVVYKDEPGKDRWKSPATVNAEGSGKCSDLSRAVAPFVDASHVAVVKVPTEPGAPPTTHNFLIKADPSGAAPITIGADGKALSPIPAERIHDESAARGMNGGQPLPLEAYQGATLSPIWPPHVTDLSHVHAPAADRAAEGNAYQGAPRLHAPATPEGGKVAETAHLAARNVTPPAAHEARPIGELYEHPVLNGIAKAEDKLKAEVGWKTTPRIANGFIDGLVAIVRGEAPAGAALPGDPEITPAHKAAATAMLNFMGILQAADRGDTGAQARLDQVASELAAADHATPAGDVKKTAVSEVDAMLPGVVPHHVRKHVVSERKRRDEGLPFFVIEGGDPDTDTGNLPLSMALGAALGGLDSWSVGHPNDGRRPPRPRRVADPRMGAAPGGHGGPPGAMTPATTGSSSSSLLLPDASPMNAPGGMGGGARPFGRGDGRDWNRGRGIGRFGIVEDDDNETVDLSSGDDDTITEPADGGADSAILTDTITTDTYANQRPATIVRPRIVVEQTPAAPLPRPRVIREPGVEITREQAPQTVGWWDRVRGRNPNTPGGWPTGRAPGGYRGGYVGQQAQPGYGGAIGALTREGARQASIANSLEASGQHAASQHAALNAAQSKAAALNMTFNRDPNMHGFGDVYLLDHGLRHAMDRYLTKPGFRAWIDAGNRTERGYGLDDILRAMGRRERVVIDPWMRGAKEDPRMGVLPPLHAGGRFGGSRTYPRAYRTPYVQQPTYVDPYPPYVYDCIDPDDMPAVSTRSCATGRCGSGF